MIPNLDHCSPFDNQLMKSQQSPCCCHPPVKSTEPAVLTVKRARSYYRCLYKFEDRSFVIQMSVSLYIESPFI